MIVRLVGGGRDADATAALFADVVADARARAGDSPRIHLLLILEPGDDESVARFAEPLRSAGGDVRVHAIAEGGVFSAAAVDGADAIVVGGGLTPAYHAAVLPIAVDVRRAVTAGVPYLGFSAGASIAAAGAVVGGFRLDGVVIGDEAAGEELDEVAVVDGLGLVPFAVDVHAAQWGTVSRLIAVVDAGLVSDGWAVDEHTALVVRTADADSDVVVEVTGAGAAWHVTRRGGETVVGRKTAGPV